LKCGKKATSGSVAKPELHDTNLYSTLGTRWRFVL
jgi:hypothetical protein